MKLFPRYFLAASLPLFLVLFLNGCKNNQNPANTDTANNQDQAQNPSTDPAEANIAPISNASTSQSGVPAQESDQDAGEQNPPDQSANADGSYDDSNYDTYDQPVDYASQPPPQLPEYDQPACPGDNYIWTPGYWSYAPNGYYWVPGAWVTAPYSGALWTPGYWGWDVPRHSYGWHRGFWGRHVGYYGGVNYGFGYVGYGYQGGYWNGEHFDYNRTVNNVNVNIVRNVYNYRIVNNNVNRVSYNGPGGLQTRPRPAEMVAIREQHAPPMRSQIQQAEAARSDRANFDTVNHGRPQMVAASHPLQADHVTPPPPVPMRRPASSNAGREQPRPNQPSPAEAPRSQPAPRAQEPVPQRQQPNPVEHPQQQQPAPARQTPQQHAQPAPERERPVPPPAEQRSAPVQHPQRTEPAPQRTEPQQRAEPAQQHAAPQQRPAEQRPAPVQHPAQQHPAPPHATSHPAPEHRNPPPKKPEDKRPQ